MDRGAWWAPMGSQSDTTEMKECIQFLFGCVGLCCCSRAFSSCGVWASHWDGFFCCGTQALEHVDLNVHVHTGAHVCIHTHTRTHNWFKGIDLYTLPFTFCFLTLSVLSPHFLLHSFSENHSLDLFISLLIKFILARRVSQGFLFVCLFYES